MSILFDGVDDVYTYAIPASGAGPVNLVNGTSILLARFVSSASWASLVEIYNGLGIAAFSTGRHSGGAMYFSDQNTLRLSNEAGAGTSFTIGTGDNWCYYIVTKAAGTVSPVFHKIPVGGSRSTYTPTATSVNAASMPNGSIKLGGDDDFANVRVAAAAVMPQVVLTTGQIDTIAAAKTTQSMIDVAGTDGWVVDAADGLLNNLVANNTNRSAIGGAPASDGDNPAGYSYFGAAAAASMVVANRRADRNLLMGPPRWF